MGREPQNCKVSYYGERGEGEAEIYFPGGGRRVSWKPGEARKKLEWIRKTTTEEGVKIVLWAPFITPSNEIRGVDPPSERKGAVFFQEGLVVREFGIRWEEIETPNEIRFTFWSQEELDQVVAQRRRYYKMPDNWYKKDIASLIDMWLRGPCRIQIRAR